MSNTPTLVKPGPKALAKPPVRNVDRWAMASVLGADITAGDRIGCIDGWMVKAIGDPVPGACTDRASAIDGRCVCSLPGVTLPTMPKVTLIGTDGTARTVYAHLRYAIAARTTTRTGGRR